MLKAIKGIFTAIGIMFAGMIGGQGRIGNIKTGKGIRRFGIPFLSVLTGWADWGWQSLFYLLFIPTLVCGYGVNSWLMGICGIEWVVRFVYAILLSLPFYGFSWKRGLIASFSLIIVFAVRAGSAGTIWGMDILIEDICRYGTLGILVVLNNVTRKRNF